MLTAAAAVAGSNTGSDIEVAKPPVFSREVEKIGDFIIACRLFLKMKIRGVMIEEWIQ